jgi:glycerophosphoryl diester phosphodiesterase
MNIVEQQSIGKHSQETNEDGIIATADFIAVVDGSTSKSPFQIQQGMSNGRYAMLMVKEVVENASATTSLSELCVLLTKRFKEVCQRNGISNETLLSHP